MLPLTLAIITRDEVARIAHVISSVGSVAEILVLDSGSMDGTVERARALGARVEVVDWPGYGAQKNRALDRAEQQWVLSLDADEVLSAELLESIRELFKGPMAHNAYAVRRRNHWRGRPVRGGVYAPAWKTRLVRKGRGRWVGGILHETLETEGSVGRLVGLLEHTPYRDREDYRQTAAEYAHLFAKKNLANGRRAHLWDGSIRPILHFVKAFLLKAGFLDGKAGWELARLEAGAVGLKWRVLRTAQLCQDTANPKE